MRSNNRLPGSLKLIAKLNNKQVTHGALSVPEPEAGRVSPRDHNCCEELSICAWLVVVCVRVVWTLADYAIGPCGGAHFLTSANDAAMLIASRMVSLCWQSIGGLWRWALCLTSLHAFGSPWYLPLTRPFSGDCRTTPALVGQRRPVLVDRWTTP